ncbi:hypothetical protein ACLB1E_21225 [Escherichia coli]
MDVREAVGSSALFVARFRECAARALLMPAACLAIAPRSVTTAARQSVAGNCQGYPDFPVILEKT